jgi:hypothetical protein
MRGSSIDPQSQLLRDESHRDIRTHGGIVALVEMLRSGVSVEPSQQVRRIAMYSKRDLKRINFPGDVMAMPSALMVNRPRFNIYTGNF